MSNGESELYERMSMDFRSMMPCVVVSVSKDRKHVDCMPAIRERESSNDGERGIDHVEMAIIEDVPVGVLGCEAGYISVKTKVGCNGMMVFADHDVSEYDNSGAGQAVASSRFHDYSDAVFLPFEFSSSRAQEPLSYDIAMGTKKAHIGITDRLIKLVGNVEISGGNLDVMTKSVDVKSLDVKVKAVNVDLEGLVKINGVVQVGN